jgi:uncharacterized protein with HEPN domain
VSRDVAFFLEDIENACIKILRFTGQMTFKDFIGDEKTYDAVIRNLEILGEAAKRLPDDVGRQMPEIEWKKVRGLRDIVAHEYFGIDTEIIWSIIHNKVPELLRVIQKYRSPVK